MTTSSGQEACGCPEGGRITSLYCSNLDYKYKVNCGTTRGIVFFFNENMQVTFEVLLVLLQKSCGVNFNQTTGQIHTFKLVIHRSKFHITEISDQQYYKSIPKICAFMLYRLLACMPFDNNTTLSLSDIFLSLSLFLYQNYSRDNTDTRILLTQKKFQ